LDGAILQATPWRYAEKPHSLDSNDNMHAVNQRCEYFTLQSCSGMGRCFSFTGPLLDSNKPTLGWVHLKHMYLYALVTHAHRMSAYGSNMFAAAAAAANTQRVVCDPSRLFSLHSLPSGSSYSADSVILQGVCAYTHLVSCRNRWWHSKRGE
jgi:hypothetical protein